jgi:tetratricopeptide (TPR) repeat protein
MAYLYYGEAQKAKIQFLTIIREDDTFAPAYVGLAKASLVLNPDYAAGGDLEKAISLDPNYLEAHLARAEFRLFKKLYRQIIEEDAPNALEINPDCGLAYYYLAAAYLGIYEYKDALEAAQKSNELDLTIINNYYVLGYALIKTGAPEEAMAPLQTYITYVEDDMYAVYLLGQAQVAAGYFELGLENLLKAQEARKDLNEIQYHIGLAYLGMLEYEKAIEHLEIAIKKFPQWFELRVALAEAYYMTGEYLKANETINYVSGAVTDEQKAALYYWRGLSFEKLGNLDLAERDFRALLALPTDAVPEEWRSTVMEHLGSLGSEPPPPTDAGPTRVPTNTPSP